MDKLVDGRPALLAQVQPFVTGGLAGCLATTVVQPVDMIKVRIQLASDVAGSAKSPFTIARQMVKNEGILSLYRGLDAGLLRQVTYTTARMGMFRLFSEGLKSPGEVTLPLHKKAIAGLLAGGLGSLVGNPADLALVRLQADSTMPPAQRRNYTSVVNAMVRIVREEGLLALWRGSGPTVVRAMALNMGMLASYDQAKEGLVPLLGKDTKSTALAASAISGFFAVTFSLPFDFVKTKIQKMRADPVTGKMPYKGFADCAIKNFKSGGPLVFYSGYLTYYVRIAPHAMITLLALDALNHLIFRYYAHAP